MDRTVTRETFPRRRRPHRLLWQDSSWAGETVRQWCHSYLSSGRQCHTGIRREGEHTAAGMQLSRLANFGGAENHRQRLMI